MDIHCHLTEMYDNNTSGSGAASFMPFVPKHMMTNGVENHQDYRDGLTLTASKQEDHRP